MVFKQWKYVKENRTSLSVHQLKYPCCVSADLPLGCGTSILSASGAGFMNILGIAPMSHAVFWIPQIP